MTDPHMHLLRPSSALVAIKPLSADAIVICILLRLIRADEAIKIYSVFPSSGLDEVSRKWVRDAVNWNDDTVLKTRIILWVGVTNDDAVRRAPPKRLCSVLAHKHFIRQADESSLSQEGVDFCL